MVIPVYPVMAQEPDLEMVTNYNPVLNAISRAWPPSISGDAMALAQDIIENGTKGYTTQEVLIITEELERARAQCDALEDLI